MLLQRVVPTLVMLLVLLVMVVVVLVVMVVVVMVVLVLVIVDFSLQKKGCVPVCCYQHPHLLHDCDRAPPQA